MADSKGTVLVTGATGLVGARICLELILSGRRVKGLRRSTSSDEILQRTFGDQPSLLDAVHWVEGDITEVLSVYEALEGVDEVYHAAGLVSFDPSDRDKLFRINTVGTTNLVNMSLERGIKAFCHISSVAALGRSTESPLVDEQSEWTESPYNTTYAKSKYAAEQEVWRGIEEGLPAVILNPSIILGPGDWWTGSGSLFRAVHQGLRFYPCGSTGFVDVRDVAHAALLLMRGKHFGERFVLNGADCSFRHIFTLIADALGKAPVSIRVGPALAGVAWRIEKVRTLFTGKPPVITRETAHTSTADWRYDGSKVCRSTGLTYTPIDSSVRDWAEVFQKSFAQR